VFRIAAGSAESPVILHVPHSSRHITAAALADLVDDRLVTTGRAVIVDAIHRATNTVRPAPTAHE
jgi:hypothetical protein